MKPWATQHPPVHHPKNLVLGLKPNPRVLVPCGSFLKWCSHASLTPAVSPPSYPPPSPLPTDPLPPSPTNPPLPTDPLPTYLPLLLSTSKPQPPSNTDLPSCSSLDGKIAFLAPTSQRSRFLRGWSCHHCHFGFGIATFPFAIASIRVNS
jgi:hypothetical protein